MTWGRRVIFLSLLPFFIFSFTWWNSSWWSGGVFPFSLRSPVQSTFLLTPYCWCCCLFCLPTAGDRPRKQNSCFFWGVGILVVGRGKPCYAINFKMAQPLLIWHWKGLSQLPKVPGQRNYFSSATSQFWLCTPLPSLSFVWKHTLVHKELDSFVFT